jgi:soluble lytic murein transglycosylase
VKPGRWLLLLLLLGAGLAILWRVRMNWLEHSQDKPILAAARHYGVDPALVKAVVWRESRFHPDARGRAGEIGLMQVQGVTAGEWADAEHNLNFVHAHCLDPITNTLAGTYYLAKVMRRYARTDNPAAYALADYNAGRGNVLKWIGGAAVTNSEAFIDQIGFPGTRDYVRAILARRDNYRDSFK